MHHKKAFKKNGCAKVKKQILEKQNKDLRTRHDNAVAKMEIERQEYREEISGLCKELKGKDGVIRMLQKEIHTLNENIEVRINAAVAKAVSEAVAPLKEELSKAHREIARQRAIINKDSANSSKPSSTNGFKTIPNSREASGRTQGGQKGHPGHRLKLPENMKELEERGVLERRREYHIDEPVSKIWSYISRYTIDIETKIIVTEHLYKHYGDIPSKHHNEVSYGDSLKSTIVLLSNEGVVANKRLTEIISSLTHGAVNLSTGTVDSILNGFAEKLTEAEELEAIEQDLLNGEVMNTDDTQIRTLERLDYGKDGNAAPVYEKAKKKSFRATVRTHSNEKSTLFTVNPKKDMAGIERDGILPQYTGKLCHDHESKFYNYGSDNGTCGVHLCRELKGLKELSLIEWAGDMRVFVLSMNEYKNEDLARKVSFCDAEKLKIFESEYDRIVAEGRAAIAGMDKGAFGYQKFNAMVNRLSKHKNNYMLFIRDYKVPFTNNLAERDLRSEKTKEKISGLFRSWNGLENHAKTRSFISTLKKRRIDLFSSVKNIFNGEPVLST